MNTCGCDHGTYTGQAFHAVHRLRSLELGDAFRLEDWLNTTHVLVGLTTRLEGDAPLILDVQAEADKLQMTEAALRAELDWLARHELLAVEGDVGGFAFVWLNPAVVFVPGTDPRVLAARHRIPYVEDGKMQAPAGEPVVFLPYTPALWEAVYEAQRDFFEDPPVFARCDLHA